MSFLKIQKCPLKGFLYISRTSVLKSKSIPQVLSLSLKDEEEVGASEDC